MKSPTLSIASLLKRLSLPTNRLDALSFCSPTLEGIDRFLSDLPVANTPEVLNRLYRAVPEVAALSADAEHQLAMLLRLQPTIFHHVDQLTERLIVTDKTARQLSLALALLKNLALGYKAVVVELLPDSAEHSPVQHQLLANALQLALSALARMLTTSWLCFVNPPANLWREIHALFLIARACCVETLTPFSSLSIDNPSLAPRTAYLRILLVSAADPARLSPRDLKLLLSFLDRHAQHAELFYQGENTLFVIDPDKDRGPILRTRMRTASPTFIGFDSTRLVTYIDRHLTSSEINLPPRLLIQVRRYWSTEILRREEHREERQQVRAVFGLSRLHRLLTQTANIDDFVSRNQLLALRAGQPLLPIEDTLPHRTWQDSRENEPGIDISWLRFSRNNPDLPISYTPQLKQKPETTAGFLDATQVNISDHGTCIELGTMPDNLSPGELVAIQDPGSPQWRLGLVRWTRITTSFSRLAGIEFLNLGTLPCAIALIRDSQRASAFFPAFLTRSDSGEESLLVPSLPFTEGNQALLIEGQQRHGVRLNRTIEATPQVTLFDLGRQQLP